MADAVARFADMFTALGSEPRLRIVRLLLAAHPDGLVVGEIQRELDIAASTLSHHLDRLRADELVSVVKEQRFQRYRANTDTLRQLLAFLYAECCSRNSAVKPEDILVCSQ